MNILTFDVEEWFHLLDHESTKSELEWNNFECRIHNNMDKIFSFLELNDLKATFFVVGWIAEKYPEIVKRIDAFNHEIGSHTHMHQLMYEKKRDFIEEDLKKSIHVLENITGKKVESFRAPGFSITQNNKWVFELLVENGILFDSSIFPARRAHGGFPNFKEARPSTLIINGIELKEFPINTISILNKNWIFSGGGYFRITPYTLIKYFTNNSNYVMTYFHPRDFDPDQPIIEDLPPFRKFKSYIGLNNSLNKLQSWISDFKFIDLRTANSIVDWNNSPVLKF
ncbi:polysaccharide deacetylase family protein [Flavobacteriaceae bacterium]|nr:polysaccharide deacetylase family protein [Flavobacteriaceae bacterium]